uniref:Electron transfer flavoprotein (Alpha subunit) n=1 Tax=mine drainage metagenome TaxID=410659 RepID=E6QMT0_9ZZZZ
MSGVIVFLESKSGELSRISREAIAAGASLAASLNTSLDLAMVGAPTDASFHSLGGSTGASARAVYAIEHPLLAHYTSDAYTAACAQLLAHVQPDLVIFPHTYQVRDFAPRLATRLGRALIGDVTAIHAEGSEVTFTRQLFQGKLNGLYRAQSPAPCLVSVQAGAFRAEAPQPTSAAIQAFRPEIAADSIRTTPGDPFRAAAQTVDLASASILVSVGRGIKDEANLPLVQELATALGAELAASRPICDAGWLPMERQVGSSGQTVAPKLYLAVGISGAIQHLVGMKASQCIVAINKDEHAPIFEVADYGIVGDLFEVVPALTAAVRKASA